MSRQINIDMSKLWEKIRARMQQQGLDFNVPDDFNFPDDFSFPEGFNFCGDWPRVKVVCVSPDLKESVEEMGRKQRDNVVMVRVDGETLESLDAWVATGAVKSRSEAAALFIREGLEVRSDELDQLRDALREVREAQEKLKNKAKEIFGQEA